MNSVLNSLNDRHQQLLDLIDGELKQEGQDEVFAFLDDLAHGGTDIADPRQRSHLRGLIRFWSSFLYDHTGEFAQVQLLPFVQAESVGSQNVPSDAEIDSAKDNALRGLTDLFEEWQRLGLLEGTEERRRALAVSVLGEVVGKAPMPEGSEIDEVRIQEASERDRELEVDEITSHDVPTSIGPYEILEEIGEGGFSRVYQAKDTRNNVVLALKVLKDQQLLRSSGVRQQLLEREKLTASLEHPHILPVYEVAEHEHSICIAMRLVASGSLADFMSYSYWHPSTREILDLVRQVADGLSFLHSNQLIHRDVKPSNILLTYDRQAYLSDLSTVQVLGSAFRDKIIGTPEYMAPEAILHLDRVDQRADIYSLGVILFQLFMGKPPFTSETASEVLYYQVNQAVPEMTEVPEEIARVIDRCLAKEPKERFQTASEVREVLAKLLESLPTNILETSPNHFTTNPEGRFRSHATVKLDIPALLAPSQRPSMTLSVSPSASPYPRPGSLCPRCGAISRVGARFCANCGASLSSVAPLSSRLGPDTVSLDAAKALAIHREPLAVLIVRSGSATSTDSFMIRSERTLVGRAATSDLRLDDPTVSRQHALIVYERLASRPGSFTMHDLASSNGVEINGKPIRDKCLLKHNDSIKLGAVELLFKRLDDNSEPARRRPRPGRDQKGVTHDMEGHQSSAT